MSQSPRKRSHMRSHDLRSIKRGGTHHCDGHRVILYDQEVAASDHPDHNYRKVDDLQALVSVPT